MRIELIVPVVVIAVLAGLGYWLFRAGHWARMREFLSEVRTEMRKVTFPTRDEVVATTIVVLITSFVFAAFLFAADRLIIWLYQGIVSKLG